MKPWDIEGKWSVSHFGWAEDVRKEMPLLPKKVTNPGRDVPGRR